MRSSPLPYEQPNRLLCFVIWLLKRRVMSYFSSPFMVLLHHRLRFTSKPGVNLQRQAGVVGHLLADSLLAALMVGAVVKAAGHLIVSYVAHPVIMPRPVQIFTLMLLRLHLWMIH